MATIDQLTHAAVLDRDMKIPVEIFGQTLYITLGQLLASQNTLTLVQYSADGTDGSWHDETGTSDKFMRISTDGGNTWGPTINLYDPDAQPTQGADGKSLYTWMKFADTDNPQTGADIYDAPRTTTTAIGWAYNKTSPTESTDPNDYEWTRFRGRDAVQTAKVQEYFAVGASSTLPPSLGWVEVPQNAMPAMSAEEPYLWNYEKTTYTDGTWRDTTPHVVGQMGADGNSITSVTDYYLAHKNATGVRNTYQGWTADIDEAQAQWGETLPYLWNYEERHWSDGGTDKTRARVIARWAKDGEDGQSVTVDSSSVTYSTQHTALQPADGTFTLTSVPANLSSGDYLWARSIVTFTDGKSTKTYSLSRIGVDGDPGKDGTSISIASTSVTYAVNTSGTQPADSSFTHTTIPTLSQGAYLWTKTVVTYSDGKSTKTYSVSRIGTDGQNGQSIPGNDGKTYYVHFAYATSSDGSVGFKTTPFDGATYIGICTDLNVADPTSHTAYTWSRYRGDDGLTPIYNNGEWVMQRNPTSTLMEATKTNLTRVQTNAANALSTAQGAKNTAEGAKSTAEEAASTASNALTTAQGKTSLADVKNLDLSEFTKFGNLVATQSWIGQQGYALNSTLQSNVSALQSAIDGKVTMKQVEGKGYTTIDEVEEQGYVKVQNASGYHEVYLTVIKNDNNALEIQACGFINKSNKDNNMGVCFPMDKGLSKSEVQKLIDSAISSGSVSVVNSNPTLSWGAQSTIGTVGGTALQVTMPTNPVANSSVMNAHTVRNLPGFPTLVDDPKTYFISDVSTDSYGHVTKLSRDGIDLTQYATKSGLSTMVNNAVLAALPSKWAWADISGAPDMSQYVTTNTAQTITGAKTFTSAVTASSFVKSGGTSSQFLKADGSVDGNTYLTGHQSLDYQNILDVRGVERNPNYYAQKRMYAWFNDSGVPTSSWCSGIQMKGWADNYTSWQICANSTTSRSDSDHLYFRTGINSAWGSWNTLAFTSDTVANASHASAASQLDHSVTLWGQSTTLSGNVSGDMTGVGSITASGTIKTTASQGFNCTTSSGTWSYQRLQCGSQLWDIAVRDNDFGGALQFRYAGLDAKRMTLGINGTLHVRSSGSSYDEGIRLYGTAKDSAWSNINFGCDPSAVSGTHANQWILGRNASNNFVLDVKGSSGNIMTWQKGGNVGIGTTSPGYKLDVNGSFNATTLYENGSRVLSANNVVNSNPKLKPNASNIIATIGGVGIGCQIEDYATKDYLDTWWYGSGSSTDAGIFGEVCEYVDNGFLDNVTGTNRVRYISSGSTATMRLMTVQNTGTYAGYNTPLEIGMQSYSSWRRQDAFIRVAASDYGGSWNTFWFGSDGRFTCPGSITVYGSINIVGKINKIDASGNAYAVTDYKEYLTMPSDARLKNIISYIQLDIRDIARMPAVEFAWKETGERAIGSIAQQWRAILPLAIGEREDGMLTLQYANAALISVISVARKTCDHESRIQTLERENRELKEKIKELENINS